MVLTPFPNVGSSLSVLFDEFSTSIILLIAFIFGVQTL